MSDLNCSVIPKSEELPVVTSNRKDKYFKLSDADFNIILSEEEMLNDTHMYKFRELLLIESNSVMKMQNTLYLDILDEITPIDKNQKHIQILFSGNNEKGHWICTYYDAKNLYVYDSLNCKCLNQDQFNFLERLYPFKPKPLYRTVQQQPNFIDCGLYAIAFATSVYFGIMPDEVRYNHVMLRQHIYTMFRNNCLMPFPYVLVNNFSVANSVTLNEFIVCAHDDKKRSRAIKDKERKRKLRSEETKEEKLCRQDEDKKRKSNAKLQEIEKEKHGEKNLVCKKTKLMTEIEKEKREITIVLNKENTAIKDKERKRKLRSEETKEEKLCRQDKDKKSKRNAKLQETEKEKHDRREKNLACKKKKNERNKINTLGIAFMSNKENEVPQNYLGYMDVKCKFCGSLNFLCERPIDGKFKNCCHKGKVKLKELSFYPNYLKNLICDLNSSESKNFKECIRSYNSALAFASMGAQLQIPKGYGPFIFRINGQVFHNTYSLHPNDTDRRKYGQLYIIDTNSAVQERLNNVCNKKCLPSLILELDILIRDINPFAKAFKMMREVELAEELLAKSLNQPVRDIQMWIKRDRSLDQNKYNVPTCNEVAVVFVSQNGEPPMDRDICIHPKDSKSISISSISANVDPMVYVLMFPSGDPGWTVNIRHTEGNRNVTPLQFYTYRLAYRGDFNPCLSLGKLTQQYIVDVWCRVEGERLKYIRQQQTKLRAEMYCGLMDYMSNKAKDENVKPGKLVILPSTFIGGPRSYQQSFMDAMRLVQEYGKPELFITMTCNPNWPEIQENLQDGQTASDRPDIVVRVFHEKVKVLMIELKEKQIFGVVVAFIYVIEFQKRGLPHIHLILFLDKKFAIRDAETVDKIIRAEIPDEQMNPRLYGIVKQFQIHGPCGNQNMKSPCMDPDKKVCSKLFPKSFCSETNYHTKGYPMYRRRKDGKQIFFYNNNAGKRTIKAVADNSFVVPYNPYLSLTFNCHINVEVCSTVECIKYLFKYCYKGHDCAVIGYKDGSKELQYDEIEKYLNTRYVSSTEGMYRLLEYNIHEQSHATYRLAVHLPDNQQIYFKEGFEKEAINNYKNTTLTAWFELNKRDPEACNYLYTEIPNHYVFMESSKTWKIRERFFKPLLSRMYFVNPKDIERYYLRTLLLYVRGAKSFEDIRTFDGFTYNTFAETARARKLLIDDNEWDNCLAEGVSIKFPKELCRLFAYICVSKKYKEHMIFDTNISTEISVQRALMVIDEVLNYHGFTLDHFGLPPIDLRILQNYNSLIKENNLISLESLKAEAEILIKSLNSFQRQIFDNVLDAVRNDDCINRYIFVDGPGGSGKSYLHNTIITAIESEGFVVLSVAWTGIAANLLKGGRTSHSMFKFPIPLNEDSTCNISGTSKQAKIIRSAKLIIWDEITMVPKYALQAMELMLRDITNCNQPFGGKVILLSGDFRQTLPIVRHGSRTHIVEACVKSSNLWKHFKHMSLQTNIRVGDNQEEFSNWLLKIGEGKAQNLFEKENQIVEIPQEFISKGNLIDEIYGSSITPYNKSVYSFGILSPTNSDVLDLNEAILSILEGEETVYYSIDNTNNSDNDSVEINEIVPVEFLNSLTPDGLPPHKLCLKKGAIIMLLRNMNLIQGLCNGTRLVVRNLLKNVICAEIISGKFSGENVFIPRIDLSPSADAFPFKMVRRQFPVRLAYAMTINKSQGQSFDKVGIFLPNPVFSHGQLYVALSRVKSKKELKIHAIGSAVFNNPEYPNQLYTKNIVYHEIL